MNLDPELLDAARSPNEFRATLDAHGLYHASQFVLRLSPLVHQRLAAMGTGLLSAREVTREGLQAFSTYLHETIHWWQHVGTTHGLMRSLSYPAQALANYGHCKKVLSQAGFRKSLRALASGSQGSGRDARLQEELNIILNNHEDIEFFRKQTYSPATVRKAATEPLFESIGHSFNMAYVHNLFTLATTVDPNFEALPDPRKWQPAFDALADNKVAGFYYGSPVSVWPLGVFQIFEGQARLSQLQYLNFASGGTWDWDECIAAGMMKGVYGEAFELFLKLVEIDWPPSIDHPAVALFLVICDMSMNPGAGFPFEVRRFDEFIHDVDPGARFTTLCRIVHLAAPEALTIVREYSRDEYVELTTLLSKGDLVESPIMLATECTRWLSGHSSISALMHDHETFQYSDGNIPIKVLFSHFLAFTRDKLAAPEFFCWPGAQMAREGASTHQLDLFRRHEALFIDKEDDDGIFPRRHSSKDERCVQDMFQQFHTCSVAFDMYRQWVECDGPFVYDYSWLSQQLTAQELKEFANLHFFKLYGVRPDDVLSME